MVSGQPHPQGKICVSIASPTVADALTLADLAAPRADVLEIRLDTLDKPAVDPFLKGLAKPLLFTNRARWEGGQCSTSEATRIEPLLEAARQGAAYVDIELKTDAKHQEALLAAARNTGTRVISSWHNFEETPSRQVLISILQMQYRTGAQLGKIVTLAHAPLDVLRVLSLQEQAAELDFPLIAFCMGSLGAVSRIATLKLGGQMTYAAPEPGRGAAPGQLPVAAVHSILELLDHAD